MNENINGNENNIENITNEKIENNINGNENEK